MLQPVLRQAIAPGSDSSKKTPGTRVTAIVAYVYL